MTRALRVLIADDERMARQRLQRLLSAMDNVEVVATCENGQEVLRTLEHIAVDVAVLDIQMPGLSGLALSDVAADWGVEVVFATAHPEHAVQAFEKGVADYVLKPIDAERLALALDRAKSRMTHRPSPAAATSAPIDRIGFTVRDEIRLVAPADITHAVLDGELVTVWIGSEALLADISLSDLERKLPTGQFERVHRRALVNLAHVDRLKPLPSGGYLAVMAGGQEVPVSRQAARALRKRLGFV